MSIRAAARTVAVQMQTCIKSSSRPAEIDKSDLLKLTDGPLQALESHIVLVHVLAKVAGHAPLWPGPTLSQETSALHQAFP